MKKCCPVDFGSVWEFLPSAVNVLTSSPKISDTTKREIFQLTFLRVMEKSDKSALVQPLSVFGTLSHVDCRWVL